jgi:predicted alpha/beta superfamily hydrolase
MKRFCLFPTIAVLLLILNNGIQAQTTQTQSNQIVIGTQETIYSKILNEQRNILVYVPASASSEIYTKQRYPVIYLLDGWPAKFSSVVGMIRELNLSYSCPEMIVVGIPNTDRTRDLTPTHMDSWQFLDFVMDNNLCKNSGGGEKFISFIEKELIPHIYSIYPTAPYRMLIGYSFGGLTAMNTLIHHTNLFKAYVAIDPSMSWDNQKLLKEAEKELATNNYSGISLFLGIANTMKAGMDTIKVRKDITKATEHIRSAFELRDYLNHNKQNQLKYAYRYYNNDDHGSVPTIAEYDALRFIFDYYQYNTFNFNDYKNFENLYENMSKHFGYKVKPPESIINSLVSQCLFFKLYDMALYFSKLNVSNYPENYNVYNSMGDYYDATGDKANAINNYEKALSIKEVSGVRKKLEKLRTK